MNKKKQKQNIVFALHRFRIKNNITLLYRRGACQINNKKSVRLDWDII
jgi:hypothetical protein